jgi:hypothetical protein
VKINSNGEKVWKITIGGSGEDHGHSIITTPDSGYVLTGSTHSNDGDFSGMNKGSSDIFLVKVNSIGEIEWKKTFGGSSYENSYSITSSKDGGYVLTGSTNSNDGDFSGMNKGGEDIFVIKLNSNGEIVWKKTFGGKSNEEGSSILTTIDNNYVLTGVANSINVGKTYPIFNGDFNGMDKGYQDIFVIKLNSNGDIVWRRIFGGTDNEKVYSITNTTDGEYVLTGETSSYDGDFSGLKDRKKGIDIFVLKLNSNVDLIWNKTYGGRHSEQGYSITTTIDSGFVLTGSTHSNDGDFNGMNKKEMSSDIYVMKINSSGDILWNKTICGGYCNSMLKTNDSGYVLTGVTSPIIGNSDNHQVYNEYYEDLFVMKLDKNGNLNKK